MRAVKEPKDFDIKITNPRENLVADTVQNHIPILDVADEKHSELEVRIENIIQLLPREGDSLQYFHEIVLPKIYEIPKYADDIYSCLSFLSNNSLPLKAEDILRNFKYAKMIYFALVQVIENQLLPRFIALLSDIENLNTLYDFLTHIDKSLMNFDVILCKYDHNMAEGCQEIQTLLNILFFLEAKNLIDETWISSLLRIYDFSALKDCLLFLDSNYSPGLKKFKKT